VRNSDILDNNRELILRSLWKNSIIGLATVDADGYFLKANDKLCEMLQYTEVELQQRDFASITHPDDVHEDIELALQVKEKKRTSYLMFKKYITKNGNIIDAELTVFGVFCNKEEFLFYLVQVKLFEHIKEKVENLAAPQSKIINMAGKWYVWASAAAFMLAESIKKVVDYFFDKGNL